MNYRHQFHAGNFADVMKHVLLMRLLRALQRKEKGFLYLDTHAGRGSYDLSTAATGDSRERQPEWPEGVGRLWSLSAAELPAAVAEYVALVREFDRQRGNLDALPRFYPGSPWIARLLARRVDRLALHEKHPAEFAALKAELGVEARTSVKSSDGYAAIRASLPPPERRGMVLIDPPYEAQDEFAQVADALQEALRRFPEGIVAVWYPLTARARADAFLAGVEALGARPALVVELEIAGESSPLKMKGCGLLVVNPPWKFEEEARPVIEFLTRTLAQAPGATGLVEWLVREKA